MAIRQVVFVALALSWCLTGALAGELVVSGDLRLRFESVDEEGRAGYWRERIRARVRLEAELGQNLRAVFRLATGSDDPTSTNQSMGDAFSSKDIKIDCAYLDWRLSPIPETDLRLFAGKMENPFHRPQKTGLLWDGDLTPEGLALGGQGGRLFGSVGVFVLDDDGKHTEGEDSPLLTGGQFGLRSGGFRLGVGVFGYATMEGAPALVDVTDGFGNTTVAVDPDGTPGSGDEYEAYANDYVIAEVFAEYSFGLGPAGLPMAVYGDFVTNTSADAENSGFAVGLKCGKADPGKVAFGLEYRSLEADAVVGAFSDSDFLGGGTGGEGVIAKLGIGLRKGSQLGITYFANTIDPSGGDTDYDRLQIDVKMKF